MLHFYSSSLEQ
ncbi:hypothetical protein CFP56_038877 [Quercus suber]|uniref:Uncharacterized protein n=1 Tax=Quercus suber TaxID=58331 RepID=A0AAW0LQ70_QUESU